MNDIQIVKGHLLSKVGARLNMLAIDDMAETLVGTRDSGIVEQTLQRLWRQKNNRFSHEYVYEARTGSQTLGVITCYPTKLLNRLAWPTAKQLLTIRKWPLVSYVFSHLGSVWSVLTLREGREDEFHIGTLATLPESRGLGIGTKLLRHAEGIAREQGYKKMSLTVKQKNEPARRLYERMGYEVTDRLDKKPFFLYRMVKPLA
ncbi:GNAT family N-acetyltransferase [Paenibacillus sanguinis]|uniref:GNAT family N-acetyltransferase n=1 Tax=Paenibacillus sanguinis TaxID=225906 RepID=UPI000380137B|nr:GNAT family N-acetyltransferase [Paenibacillus sanguinis]